MTYSVGEAAILTLVQALSEYNSQNSSRQDWKVLDSGKAAVYAVLRPGEWSNEDTGMGMHLRSWQTVVEVWRPYRDDTKPLTLQDDVETIVAHLEQYPTLSGAADVVDAMVTGGGEMQEVVRNNNVLWARWEVHIGWQEEKEITYA